jgi:hypothetical protein
MSEIEHVGTIRYVQKWAVFARSFQSDPSERPRLFSTSSTLKHGNKEIRELCRELEIG